ncbi:hypothetical protein [uncultured Pedobacter sp.]|uniref:hypothetical protein n=1 Tax=uncultured Pedobacter sp. TaxID=246139 RepID=UPI002623FB81|nr:hypothetical protein [uncultured Pedobacter sp.]
MKDTFTIEEIQELWLQASLLHAGQKYGGEFKDQQIEYINHIGSVVFEIINAAFHAPQMDMGLAIRCALFHDALEDTGCSYHTLKVKIGERAALGVLAGYNIS